MSYEDITLNELEEKLLFDAVIVPSGRYLMKLTNIKYGSFNNGETQNIQLFFEIMDSDYCGKEIQCNYFIISKFNVNIFQYQQLKTHLLCLGLEEEQLQAMGKTSLKELPELLLQYIPAMKTIATFSIDAIKSKNNNFKPNYVIKDIRL